MTRTADYTIQGFLYQFNKTLLEILKSADDAVITVEGIVEDIEILTPDMLTAIQCKYHETAEKYTLSAIYEPLLQMMHHFYLNPGAKINYRLFAHFPNEKNPTITVTKAEIGTILKSKNKALQAYIAIVKDKIDVDKFLSKLSVEVGNSFDTLVSEVCAQLRICGIHDIDIETLVYPNAIQTIAALSIKHSDDERAIKKLDLLSSLQKIKKTAITYWTLSLKNRKQLLDARRKQLKQNLDKNSRLRYFIIHAKSIEDFETGIVLFIADYLDKYHSKPAHVSTPLLCLETTEEEFKSIQHRLFQKGITVNNGYVADVFDETNFFRDPMTQKLEAGKVRREFAFRMLRWDANKQMLNKRKADDLFILGKVDFTEMNDEDVNVEVLAPQSLLEVKYMLGIANVFE